MKHKKFIIIGIIVLIIALSFIAVGTYAYFIRKAEVTNTFTVGDINISLEIPDWTEEKGQELYPGTTLDYAPTIKATKGDCYVRLIVELLDKDTGELIDVTSMQGDVVKKTYLISGLIYDKSYNPNSEVKTTNVVPGKMYSNSDLASLATAGKINYFTNGNLKKTYNDTEFTYVKSLFPGTLVIDNGYVYNYNGILHEGESAALFSNLVLRTDLGNDSIEDLDIRIKAEAIQATNFTSSEEAFAALDAAVN